MRKKSTPRMAFGVAQSTVSMAQACEDPRQAPAVIQIAPALMASWWKYASGDATVKLLAVSFWNLLSLAHLSFRSQMATHPYNICSLFLGMYECGGARKENVHQFTILCLVLMIASDRLRKHLERNLVRSSDVKKIFPFQILNFPNQLD